MQRTLWKGAISFGLGHIPVHLHFAGNRHELGMGQYRQSI
jgi:non-homologous end joining protein Ku